MDNFDGIILNLLLYLISVVIKLKNAYIPHCFQWASGSDKGCGNNIRSFDKTVFLVLELYQPWTDSCSLINCDVNMETLLLWMHPFQQGLHLQCEARTNLAVWHTSELIFHPLWHTSGNPTTHESVTYYFLQFAIELATVQVLRFEAELAFL